MSITRQSIPVALAMPGGVTVTELGSGEKTGFALLTNGSLASWGYSQKGSLLNGISGLVSEYGPVVRNITSIGQITRLATRGRCKAIHVMAQSGLVYFWGDGTTGVSGKFYNMLTF
jgi:alpha-tubulin suppressor-like RCC1 family protein